MEGTSKGSNNTVDARAASIGSDVIVGRVFAGHPCQSFSSEQDVLATVLRWEYHDYAECCAV